MDVPWQILVGFVLFGLLGGVVTLVRAVGENPMGVKQFAIGLGIAILLPLSVYYAVELLRPAPKEELHSAQIQRVDQRIKAAPTEREKQRVREEKAALHRSYKEQEKRHDQMLFLIGYLVGVAAIILGTLTVVRAVSPGALFGGLLTLTYACFSYWDTMADWLRFSSLLGALFILTALGWWRFGREEAAAVEHAPKAEAEDAVEPQEVRRRAAA
jgi:hypothetical protein